MLDKVNDIKKYLKAKFVERDEIIDALFISLIARQHTLLIGPPGTAKSALVMEFTKQVTDVSYFQWLLTRFSTPEELFGPVSLEALEKGVYKRNTANKLPEAQVTFLDEIFKANSAILNALLTLINERLFYNNGTPIKTPLQSVIGGSNEYPEDGEGLEALFDRFLLRFELDYIGEDAGFLNMLKSNYIKPPAPLQMQEIDQLQMFADMVDIPEAIYGILLRIRTELKDEGIRPSDRRFRQSLSLLKAKAALDGRSSVKVDDLTILRNGLWETPDQRQKSHDIVDSYSVDRCSSELEMIHKTAKELYNAVKSDPTAELGMEATAKFKTLLSQTISLEKMHPERKDEIQDIKDQVIKAQQMIGEALLGI